MRPAPLLPRGAGLGCGGFSRLGMRTGATRTQAADVVRAALDLGVTVVDTAEAYGTEEAVGDAIAGRTSIVSTKGSVRGADGLRSVAALRDALEGSLRRLRVDAVDVYHLHGVADADYDYALAELAPAVAAWRDDGLVRTIGITEQFGGDPSHAMLRRAVYDGPWDVVMVGFNMLNPSARRDILTVCRRRGIATMCMFAVRNALARRERLVEVLATLGHPPEALDFLGPDVVDAAYRFCAHEPGIDVVLTGTGNTEHLRSNVRSIAGRKLPDEHLARLKKLFGSVDSVTGN